MPVLASQSSQDALSLKIHPRRVPARPVLSQASYLHVWQGQAQAPGLQFRKPGVLETSFHAFLNHRKAYAQTWLDFSTASVSLNSMNNTEAGKTKTATTFAHRLLEWYTVHARAMPWRIPPHDHRQGVRATPYHVWLSEVMLQQTQVTTVKDYFLKFIEQWPTVYDLAASDLENILKAWAGLGYYSRARNLKKCADVIVSEYGGNFPDNHSELMLLPGIGDYTASAIAAIAFDQAVPVLDGNVERVMARHRCIETYFPEAKTQARQMLCDILDPKKPGEFAQAMMDLGATICTPKRPACALCPLNHDCLAFNRGQS